MNRLRVVLVRTQFAGNIGSAARAMRNMGCSDLVLVAPEASPLDEQADAMATHHGRAILQGARIVPTISEAVADCVLVAGTSARVAGLYRGQSAASLPEVGPVLAGAMAAGPVALVFGPERTGLENDEARLCHCLVTIPADETHPVLNLAQAVAICLYEVRRSWLAGSMPLPDIAPYEEQERMLGRLKEALTRSRYLRGPGGASLFHAVRQLLVRSRLSSVEVRLLLGLSQQIDWLSGKAGL
ncbi:MAG: RNA methyltransferase [Gemmataceae bacterium]|nr:RNA methyltransferase [Gemmataceae bacterium]